MNAIQIQHQGPPEVMEWTSMADPSPQNGEVVIQTRAIGVNPVDTYIRAGSQGYSAPLPWVPGLDAAGVVEAVGDDVAGFRPGDRVYCSGTLGGAYATRILCRDDQLYPLPDTTDFAHGACLGVPFATAYRAMFQRGSARKGETLLIHGATGSVGQAALQLAQSAGLRTIGTAGDDTGCAQLKHWGVDLALNHHSSEHWQQALEWTDGKGVDLLLELLANRNLGQDLPIMAFGGRVVIIGNRGTVEINPRDAMARDLDIRGMVLFNTPPEALQEIHRGLYLALNSGDIQPRISLELPLEEAVEAHRRIEAGHVGKIILLPGDR